MIDHSLHTNLLFTGRGSVGQTRQGSGCGLRSARGDGVRTARSGAGMYLPAGGQARRCASTVRLGQVRAAKYAKAPRARPAEGCEPVTGGATRRVQQQIGECKRRDGNRARCACNRL